MWLPYVMMQLQRALCLPKPSEYSTGHFPTPLTSAVVESNNWRHFAKRGMLSSGALVNSYVNWNAIKSRVESMVFDILA
jgi:hypothetical protein